MKKSSIAMSDGASSPSPCFPASRQSPGPGLSALALVGFVITFVWGLAGLVVSIIALVRIRKTQQRGRALAIAGVVLGTVVTVLTIALAIAICYGFGSGSGLP